MCGRFALSAPVDRLYRHFGLSSTEELPPRYNIAPGQQIPAIREPKSGRELVMMLWGLVPFWAKEVKTGSGLINARSETMAEKPSFRNSFKQYRCLIPADGFYEWKIIPGQKKKQPYFIRMKDKGIFAMAGLWSIWKNQAAGDVVESCAIVTTGSNTLLAEIHDRMPVILYPESYAAWLRRETDPVHLKKLCQPYNPEYMEIYPVAGLCNNPKIESPECIAKLRGTGL